MLTVAFAALVLGVLAWMLRYRTTAVVAGFFLLFSLLTRLASLVMVDLGAEVYSEQLDTMIGNGASMPLFACSILLVMAALAWAFRPAALAHLQQQPRFGAGPDRITLWVAALATGFVAVLYLDLLAAGPVPLLTGMDRLEFNAHHAGPLHERLREHGFLLAAILGAMFVRPRLAGGDFDLRFVLLYVAVLGYFALTGNRFSSFYSFTSFFLIPVAALLLLAVTGKLPPAPQRPLWKRVILGRRTLLAASALGAAGVAGLILHSVVNVRGYADPAGLLSQRVLVQPIELWWVTWRDLGTIDQLPFQDVWTLLFTAPVDPDRNTSIQMLMVKSIGYQRTAELLGMGQQYAGGYPEVLFELLGPWLALPAALLFALPAALLLRLTVVSLCEDRLLTALLALYVFFGFSLHFVGGMLNFLTVWSFWAKIAALACAYLLERPANSEHPAMPSAPGEARATAHTT